MNDRAVKSGEAFPVPITGSRLKFQHFHPRSRVQPRGSSRDSRVSTNLHDVAALLTPQASKTNKKVQLERARTARGAAVTREIEQRRQRQENPAQVWARRAPACCPKLVKNELERVNAAALVRTPPENEVAHTPRPVIPNSGGVRRRKPQLRNFEVEAKLRDHFKRKGLGEKITSEVCAQLLVKAQLKKGTQKLDRQTRLLAHFDEEQRRERESTSCSSMVEQFNKMQLD